MATQPIRPAKTAQPTTSGQPSLPDLTVLAVPDGQVLRFRARGKGVQIYPCDPVTHLYGPARPEAILLTIDGALIHHSKGPKWEAEDGSFVRGKSCAESFRARRRCDPLATVDYDSGRYGRR